MKEVLLMKIDGARLSACENGLFFDCDAGTILILWEQIEAAQQTLALDPPSALVCSCGSVAGVHCDWCPCASTAVK